MKLGIDIGCGGATVALPDTRFVRYDIQKEAKPDVLGNATLLPFRNASFDVVHSSHCLEHFPRNAWKHVLKEWADLVKPGGEIWFNLPNIVWAAEQIVYKKEINEHVLNVLYGGQTDPYDFHYTGLTPEIMKAALEELGFEFIHYSQKAYNMFLGARKS